VFVTVGLRIREAIGGEPVDVARPPLVENPIREALAEVLQRMGAGAVEIDALSALMKVEGAATFMLERSEHRAAYQTAQNRAPREVSAGADTPDGATAAFKSAGRVLQLPFTFESLHNLSELRESIQKKDCRALVLTPYDDWQIHVIDLTDLEAALCDSLSVKREVRLAAVKRRLSRHPDFKDFEEALEHLRKKGIVGIYAPSAD